MRAGIAIEQVAEPSKRLGDLYVRNAPAALRLAYFLTGNRELAEDLVQDAFVRLAGRFRHLRQPDAVDSYLRRIIVNLFTSHLRRSRLERSWLSRHGDDVTEVSPKTIRPFGTSCGGRCRRSPNGSERRSSCASTKTCPNARLLRSWGVPPGR
jgi:RNA polymerase sigma factor (sigma-70 family)